MEPSEDRLTSIGRAVRLGLSTDLDDARQLHLAREGLLEKVAVRNRSAARPQRTWARARWMLAALAAAAAGAGILALRRPVGFEVGGTGMRGNTGDVIEASGAPLSVSFSEGSSIVVHEGGRLRVLSAEPTGARVLVEAGDVDVAIVHRRVRKTHWSFEMGSYRIVVTGTKFRAGWNPSNETFSLSMNEGSVVVAGRCLKAPRRVVAGETLELSCLPALSRPRLVVPAPGAAGGEPQHGLTPAASAPEPASREPATVSWRGLLAAGRLRDGLRAAEGVGFDRACRTASASELIGLADAARLSDRTSRAVEALGLLRERFPHTGEAAKAAFALGRIAFERRRAYDEAAHWFVTYLDEQPGGPLMGDAIGRLMEARHHAGYDGLARADAERYLRRFPEGPYAAGARSILAGP